MQWFGRARTKAGRPDLRFHDLRHTGAMMAAHAGATIAELMGRLGHATPGDGAAVPARRPGPGRGDRRPAVGAGGSGDEPVTPTEAATAADLAWWLDLAPRLTWTWATTYEASAPHHYVVAGRTPGMTWADFVLAGRVIRTFGEPGRFWNLTNVYLFTADRQRKFWCQWSRPPRDTDARVINLAKADQVFGPQHDFDQSRLDELLLPRSVDSSDPKGAQGR